MANVIESIYERSSSQISKTRHPTFCVVLTGDHAKSYSVLTPVKFDSYYAVLTETEDFVNAALGGS